MAVPSPPGSDLRPSAPHRAGGADASRATRRRRERVARALGVALTVASALGIAWLTLTPKSELPATPRPWCFTCGELGGLDFALNIALFIPLGFALRMAGVRPRRALLACAGATLAIELLQLGIPGRVTSTGDLVSNTLGGALGVALGSWWRVLLFPGAVTAWRLAAACAAGWLAMLAGTMWMLQPDPPDSVYYGQIAADLGQFDRFRGEVLSAAVGPLPLRDGRMRNSAIVRDLLRREGTAVRAVATTSGEHTRRVAPIASIFDNHQREVMVLGQMGADAIYRTRHRSSALGFRTPDISVWSVFPAAAGDTIALTAWEAEHRLHLVAERGGERMERTIELRPTWGWALILPFENVIVPRYRAFTAWWLALLALPLGYYAGHALRGRARGRLRWWPLATVPLLAAAVLALGLEGLPRALGLSPGEPWEWRGALAGLAAGLAAALPARWMARWLARRPAHSRHTRSAA
ncbi:MAG TPA: VanZ family protein [Gemmatimonadaceae bacterium]|nr:VanZ family protein [Gemmatimonadaceae bacterium]